VQEKYISSLEFPNSQFNDNNLLGSYNLFSKKNVEYIKEEPSVLILSKDAFNNMQKIKS